MKSFRVVFNSGNEMKGTVSEEVAKALALDYKNKQALSFDTGSEVILVSSDSIEYLSISK